MINGSWSATEGPPVDGEFGHWSTKPVNGANPMIKRYALFPLKTPTKERYLEMKAFCTQTFGGPGGLRDVWDSSYMSFSFGFRKENDRLVFLMKFYNG